MNTNTIKKIISWALGIPSVVLIFSEATDLRYVWIQLVAIATLTAILFWNGVFKGENERSRLS